MKKKTTSISINVLSAMVILLCLLLSVVQPVNSWFTAIDKEGIRIDVFVGNLNLNLYQDSISVDNEIYTNQENQKPEVATKKYVTLDGEILPDEWVDLKLILANDDLGSSGMFVRFKFELFMRGVTADTLLTSIITSDKTLEEPENYVQDFVYAGGWFTYSKLGQQAILEKNTSATLMSSFKVPFSAFESSGTENKPITNSDTVYIKLTIQAQTVQFN